jgi:hypothetical protein
MQVTLIECPACKHTVSEEAEACPGCGCPVAGKAREEREAKEREAKEREARAREEKRRRTKLRWWGTFYVLLGVAVFVGMAIHEGPGPESPPPAATPSAAPLNERDRALLLKSVPRGIREHVAEVHLKIDPDRTREFEAAAKEAAPFAGRAPFGVVATQERNLFIYRAAGVRYVRPSDQEWVVVEICRFYAFARSRFGSVLVHTVTSINPFVEGIDALCMPGRSWGPWVKFWEAEGDVQGPPYLTEYLAPNPLGPGDSIEHPDVGSRARHPWPKH